MNVSQFQEIPGAPELPASIDPNDANGVDRYIVALLQSASAAEDLLNADLPKDERQNRYRWAIGENSILAGRIEIPVLVNRLEVAA